MDHQRHGPCTTTYVPTSSPPPDVSSPAPNGLLSPTRSNQQKEKRNPSVTPRRFGRFFTPRSFQPHGRRILGNLDSAAVNRQPLSPQSLCSDLLTSDPISPSPSKRLSDRADDDSRKRKWPEEEEASPITKRREVRSGDMPPPQLNLPRQNSQSSLDGDTTMEESQESLEDRRKATLVRIMSQMVISGELT